MRSILVVALALVPLAVAQYRTPPPEILDVLHARRLPTLSLSPTRTHVALIDSVVHPTIADLSKPMLRLAGYRIDPLANGPRLTAYGTGVTLKQLPSGADMPVTLLANARLGTPVWSTNGQSIAVTNATNSGTELWVVSVATGKAKKLNVAVNAAMGNPIDWMPDHRTLLVKAIPANRGAAPRDAAAPLGPISQESGGKAGPVRTNPDALHSPHDEALFDYYGRAQLLLVDTVTGVATPSGAPDMFLNVTPSPDGQHLLVTRLLKPYSYLHDANEFPKQIDVVTTKGALVYTVAKLPLAERVPIGGVIAGARQVRWHPSEPGMLVWVQALDGGNPKEKVPHRDQLMAYRPLTRMAPAPLTKTEHRLTNLQFFAKGKGFLVSDFDRDRRWQRTFLVNEGAPKLLFSRNIQDRYKDPGAPVMKQDDGVILEAGGKLLLIGTGATPQGDRPFLDRFDLATAKAQRLFESAPGKYESVVGVLDETGDRLLIRSESPTAPPNYFIREAGKTVAVTSFPDPAPSLRGITKQLVTYQRPDGVPLSFTLYLPPGYKPGTRLPAVVWAYPREYNDPETAGQVSGSTNRFTMIGGMSHLFFLLRGYAILDDAAMPVVGDPETVNNTYVAQIVASAKAAIDKAAEMGVIDPTRVGVGGHSYGAFMTANLLAHSDLFRAGIARSGAYNRTLTPFGFQSERRTLWEAPEVYMAMSPFMVAQKIKEPILFIHGEADNNQGTFPIQSERMYQAVRGNGGTARLTILPHEAHGYAAKESIEHTLWEMVSWFDKHVKGSAPAATSE
ncbi:MAG: prolyl oligopeptidase family serine peptidase [Bryobacteraceae bacterium]|nr:prolyl oligopeptidase family serine peptidase [Bryobacteraceae bacterium]